MSDLAVSWITVAPSAWQRGLRGAALAMTAGVLAAVALVHLSGSGLFAAAASAIAMLVAALWAGRCANPRDAREWCVSADGRIAVRFPGGICRDAAVVFASPLLIVVRAGGRTLEIWRDATPLRAFRRLSVAVRWQALRHGGPALTVINPTDATERT